MPAHQDAYASWPPNVVHIQDLGYLEDSNNRYYPRDGGRSSEIQGHVLYQFGDTMAHDSKRNFVGATQSTISVVEDPRGDPTLSHYTNLNPNGSVAAIPSILPHEAPNTGNQQGFRTTLWCLGGIVWQAEIKSGIATGYTFFNRADFKMNGGMESEIHHHTGPAEIIFNTRTNQISTRRYPETDVLFGKDEPRFGTFSCHTIGNDAFLYGHGTNDDRNIMLAKVPISQILLRSAYTFWDGQAYQSDINKCVPLFSGWQHGKIWKSSLFAPGTGKDWAFVGCSSFGDSTVHMKVAPTPEGPWSDHIKLPIDSSPSKEEWRGAITYCMYSHPWAYKEEEGKLLVTWSDGGLKGGVRAVKCYFQQEKDGQLLPPQIDPPRQRISSHNSSQEIGQEALNQGKAFLKGLFKKS